MPLADQVDQPRRALGRIDRVEQDALKLGEHADRREPALRRNAIAVADVIGIGDHVLALDHAGAAQLLGGGAGEGEDVFLLLGFGRAHADAQQRDPCVHRLEPGDQPGLGAGAAGGVNDMVDPQGAVVDLGQHLEGAVDIAQRAGRVRAAAGDRVDLPAIGAQPVRDLLDLGIQIAAAGALLGGGAMQMIQKDVAVVVVVGVVRAGPILQQDVAGHAHLRGKGGGLAGVV